MERGVEFGGKYSYAVVRAQIRMNDGVQTSPDLSSWILICRKNLGMGTMGVMGTLGAPDSVYRLATGVMETLGAPDSVYGQYIMSLSLSSNTQLDQVKKFA